ncbi:hypothetical protein NXH76_14925 [Blautia schinkii]|nr:hypothetical protein [Blautia schinkii]
MKVQELRQLLSASERANLEKAFVECYKQLQKGQKEEIDVALADILEGKEAEKKKVESAVSFKDLEEQITVFIENAYAQNYFAPNRIIPKSQRPKWRFLVKNFIKDLEKVPPESEDHPAAVRLLTDIYKLICQACNYYYFNTDDPFRSIGWEQWKLYELLTKKTFSQGFSREDISRLVLLAATGGLSRESLHTDQQLVLIGQLRTSDVKYMAIEEAEKLIVEREGELRGFGKYDHKRYSLEDGVNELCGLVLMISISLAEPDTGIVYYFKHCWRRDIEITLYCALQLADLLDEAEAWLKIYEYGIKKKIKPRDYLCREYEDRVNRVRR